MMRLVLSHGSTVKVQRHGNKTYGGWLAGSAVFRKGRVERAGAGGAGGARAAPARVFAARRFSYGAICAEIIPLPEACSSTAVC